MGVERLGWWVKRWKFLVAIPAAFHALACGQEPPGPPGAGTGGTNASPGGAAAQSGSGNAGATPSGGMNATGGSAGGGNASSGASTGSKGGSPSGGGASATGGSGSLGWSFDCGDPTLPAATGARAGSADFSANSETGATEPHVLYLNGYFLIRRTRQYVTEGDADHQHEILLTDDEIDALIVGSSVVVQTNGPPLNASSGHGHTITIRSCFLM
jgi:hypothetical protein